MTQRSRPSAPTPAGRLRHHEVSRPLPNATTARRPPLAITSRSTGRAPSASHSPPSPTRRSVSSAYPFTQHPHTFVRSPLRLSTIDTDKPASANPRAAVAPAGPPPMTTAS